MYDKIFDDLSEMFNYVTDVIKVSMSLMLFMSIYISYVTDAIHVSLHVNDARPLLCNHVIDRFHVSIVFSLMDCLV